MLVFAFISILLVFFAWILWGQRKDAQGFIKKDEYMYILAVALLISVAVYYAYLYFYYWQIGEDLKYFYGCGTGITYHLVGGTNLTYYDGNDLRVGEYLALQKADFSIPQIIAPTLPVVFTILGFFLVYYYINRTIFRRKSS